MWPPPPLEASVTLWLSIDLIMPHATKPSVGSSPRNVIVTVSRIAMPLGLSDTYARRPSWRNTVQIGGLPNCEVDALPTMVQVLVSSEARTLTTLCVEITVTSSDVPSG